ncbi:MAG: ECF transporter S component [Clostridia bacterium]|nr:ECF transporter S component [Clostridia bacterium]
MKKSDNSMKIKKLVAVAMFSALAYVTTVLCGYFPKIGGFLSLEIKDAFIVICALIFGPASGLAISVLVPVIESFTISVTGWYGLIMNVLSSATFVCVTGLIYKHKRNFFGATIGLLAGIFSVTAVMCVANLLITPLYLTYMVGVPTTISGVAKMIPTILLPFNLVKAVLNGAVVLLLYKPLSTALKRSGFVAGSDKPQNSKKGFFCVRSLIVDLVAVAVIIASLCVLFFVLK